MWLRQPAASDVRGESCVFDSASTTESGSEFQSLIVLWVTNLDKMPVLSFIFKLMRGSRPTVC